CLYTRSRRAYLSASPRAHVGLRPAFPSPTDEYPTTAISCLIAVELIRRTQLRRPQPIGPVLGIGVVLLDFPTRGRCRRLRQPIDFSRLFGGFHSSGHDLVGGRSLWLDRCHEGCQHRDGTGQGENTEAQALDGKDHERAPWERT